MSSACQFSQQQLGLMDFGMEPEIFKFCSFVPKYGYSEIILCYFVFSVTQQLQTISYILRYV